MPFFAQTSEPASEKISSAARDLWEFFYAGGFFMLLIVLCSVFAITVVIYKCVSLTRMKVLPADTEAAVRRAADPDGEGGPESQRAAADRNSPLGRIAAVAVSPRLRNRIEAQDAAASTARAEVVRLESGIPALEVVITIAPLLGLLGTASGLVDVFGAHGGGIDLGEVDAAKLGNGIARALSTTIAGLAVAVPTVIAHSFFSKRIERFAVEMEILIGALINRVHAPAGR